jgi:hypothetical protein
MGILIVCLLFAVVSADCPGEIKQLFSKYTAENQFLSVEQFEKVLPEDLHGIVSPTQLKEWLIHYDLDRDNVVSEEEFSNGFPESKKASKKLKQGHLSLGDGDSMWIMWVTDEQHLSPTVRWGSTPTNLSETASGTWHTYK